MRDFSSLDLYNVDSLLSDEERMVRDSVRKWGDKRILPEIEDWASRPWNTKANTRSGSR